MLKGFVAWLVYADTCLDLNKPYLSLHGPWQDDKDMFFLYFFCIFMVLRQSFANENRTKLFVEKKYLKDWSNMFVENSETFQTLAAGFNLGPNLYARKKYQLWQRIFQKMVKNTC